VSGDSVLPFGSRSDPVPELRRPRQGRYSGPKPPPSTSAHHAASAAYSGSISLRVSTCSTIVLSIDSSLAIAPGRAAKGKAQASGRHDGYANQVPQRSARRSWSVLRRFETAVQRETVVRRRVDRYNRAKAEPVTSPCGLIRSNFHAN